MSPKSLFNEKWIAIYGGSNFPQKFPEWNTGPSLKRKAKCEEQKVISRSVSFFLTPQKQRPNDEEKLLPKHNDEEKLLIFIFYLIKKNGLLS